MWVHRRLQNFMAFNRVRNHLLITGYHHSAVYQNLMWMSTIISRHVYYGYVMTYLDLFSTLMKLWLAKRTFHCRYSSKAHLETPAQLVCKKRWINQLVQKKREGLPPWRCGVCLVEVVTLIGITQMFGLGHRVILSTPYHVTNLRKRVRNGIRLHHMSRQPLYPVQSYLMLYWGGTLLAD